MLRPCSTQQQQQQHNNNNNKNNNNNNREPWLRPYPRGQRMLRPCSAQQQQQQRTLAAPLSTRPACVATMFYTTTTNNNNNNREPWLRPYPRGQRMLRQCSAQQQQQQQRTLAAPLSTRPACVATMFCNLLVGFALLRFPSLRNVSNLLIGNLALSDFLLSVTVLPLSAVNECLGHWVGGLCHWVASRWVARPRSLGVRSDGVQRLAARRRPLLHGVHLEPLPHRVLNR